MAHSVGSRPVPPSRGLEGTKQAQLNERHMLHSDPYGPEATYVPPQILDAANSGMAQQIEIILEYLKQVPKSALENFSEYGDEENLRYLLVLKNGLEKVEKGFHPSDLSITDDELMLITGPGSVLKELADAFGQIAFSERMDVKESRFIRANIQQPLAELARLPVASPTVASLIRRWTKQVSTRRRAQEPRSHPDNVGPS
jgi:hypothetical protein